MVKVSKAKEEINILWDILIYLLHILYFVDDNAAK